MASINEIINDVNDLKEELEDADNGAVIVLDPDKTYICNSNTTIRVNAENVRIIGFGPKFLNDENFNPEVPEDGRAVIKGNGELTFRGCKKLQIIGFFFRLRFAMENCEDCKVEYSDFQYDTIPPGTNRVHVFRLENGPRNRIYQCKFHDKDNSGYFLVIRGKEAKRNVVERCEFCDHRFQDDGGESIVIGHSDQANERLETEISNCWFHDLKGDPETISVKSRGNYIHNCLHENNESSFTIRHGYGNRIEQCIFRKSGGIRLFGKDNHIKGNYFSNNSHDRYLPITLCNGNEDDEPESGGANTRVKNNFITGNIFENCSTICVKWGRDDRPKKPDHNHFVDNTIIAIEDIDGCKGLEFSDGAEVLHNEFAGNVVYAGTQASNERKRKTRGELPQGSYQIVEERPRFDEPRIELPISIQSPPTPEPS
jgi:hypothetical protein